MAFGNVRRIQERKEAPKLGRTYCITGHHNVDRNFWLHSESGLRPAIVFHGWNVRLATSGFGIKCKDVEYVIEESFEI